MNEIPVRRAIAQLRANLAMNQAEFAKRIGVGTSTLQGYEREDVPKDSLQRCLALALERGLKLHAKIFEAEIRRQDSGGTVELDLRPEREVLDRIEKMLLEMRPPDPGTR